LTSNADTYVFYAMHIGLLKFAEESSRTLEAYLMTRYSAEE
jgi:hypothetical protein